jgi:hypothetical protein
MALANTKNLVQQTNKLIDKMVGFNLVNTPTEYTKLAKIEMAPPGTNYVEAEVSGLGALLEKKEGQQITYDIPTERSPATRTYTMFALGFQYSLEMVQDERFGNIKKMANSLGRSASVKPDTSFWDLFNSGFATHTAWDGNYIFVASGRTLLKETGTSQNNRPSSDGALSETTLQAGMDYFATLKGPEGFPILMEPKYLITANNGTAFWNARVLLGTSGKPGSMNNDKSTVPEMGLTHFPCRYVTSTDAWFLVAEQHDFSLKWKMKATHNNTDDFSTGNFMHNVMERFLVYCNDPTGCYGNAGA